MVSRGAVERSLLVIRRRVEVLEARVAVVVAVRVVAVEHEVARDLDLVRRVVREVPRRGRVAEPDLEQHRRHEEHRADDRGQPDRRPARPRAEAPARRCGERDEEPGEDRRRAEDPQVPLAVGDADERAEDSTRVDRGRIERPGSGAEVGHRDPDEHAERRQQRPGLTTSVHVSSMASSSARQSRKLAATAIVSQVTGSSKKPLYASECTNSVSSTARARARVRDRGGAHVRSIRRRLPGARGTRRARSHRARPPR